MHGVTSTDVYSLVQERNHVSGVEVQEHNSVT